jgi:D-glycero-D-manno-heptose 1,7-bisphosphate phosphatase
MLPKSDSKAQAKVAIFDRDGTIVDVVRDEESGFVGVAFHPSHLKLLRGAVQGLTAFSQAGFKLAIATNQPGPAKGQFSRDAVIRTNAALVELLASEGVTIDYVAVCMHHEVGGSGGDAALVRACACRKPKPGLLTEVLLHFGASESQSWMIGDSPGDIVAGTAAGVRTAMVLDTKRCELCPLRPSVMQLHEGNGPGSALPQMASLAIVHGASLKDIANIALAIES